MKWNGETEHQWMVRTARWHKCFCFLPRQMHNGKWVWLERCWTRRVNSGFGGWSWEYSDSIAEPDDVRPSAPPPPPR